MIIWQSVPYFTNVVSLVHLRRGILDTTLCGNVLSVICSRYLKLEKPKQNNFDRMKFIECYSVFICKLVTEIFFTNRFWFFILKINLKSPWRFFFCFNQLSTVLDKEVINTYKVLSVVWFPDVSHKSGIYNDLNQILHL